MATTGPAPRLRQAETISTRTEHYWPLKEGAERDDAEYAAARKIIESMGDDAVPITLLSSEIYHSPRGEGEGPAYMYVWTFKPLNWPGEADPQLGRLTRKG